MNKNIMLTNPYGFERSPVVEKEVCAKVGESSNRLGKTSKGAKVRNARLISKALHERTKR